MDVLDVQPYETALQRLLRAGVCRDEQLYDYQLSQALRSLAFAVNRSSVVAPVVIGVHERVEDGSAPSSSVSPLSKSLTTGGIAVLCRVCALLTLSYSNLRTAVYLSMRLLCDESSAFGEGNERPMCTAAWVEAICSVNKKAYLTEQMSIHRRIALGYVLIVGGTVREVARGRVHEKQLSSHYTDFVHRIFTDVIPHLALMADGQEWFSSRSAPSLCARANPTTVTGAVVKGDKDCSHIPSRLTTEANNAIIQIFHDLSGDMLIVHKTTTNNPKRRCLVLDRDLPAQMWPVLSTLRRAISRALCWIQAEAIGYLERNSTSDYREMRTIRDTFTQLQNALEEIFSRLIKEQETLEYASRSIEQQFGVSAKSFHEANDALWGNTLRLCFFIRSITSAWTHVHGGASDEEVEHGEKGLLSFIASFVSSVPLLEEREKDSEVFLATAAILSAVLSTVSAAPLGLMRMSLWEADTHITQQIHNIIVHRALRYRNETVQKLSALLSQLILYNSPATSAFCAIADSSEQLLDLLADGRDAASQCVVGMLTRAVVERPHTVLPALFRLLQHGDSNTRRNALDVLAALPEAIEGSSLYAVALTSEQMRPVLRLLAEELLLRVQDEELVIRLQSSKLFAKVWPEDICRPLLRLAAVRDSSGRKQSAAQSSLSIVVEAHTESSDIVLLLIEESLALLGIGSVPTVQITPSTPADMLAFSQLHSNTVSSVSSTPVLEGSPHDRISRILYLVVRHWAELVPRWTDTVVDPLVNRVITAKEPLEQEIVVRVMSLVGSICGIKDEGALALLSSCLKRMKASSWLEQIGIIESDREGDTEVMYQIIAPLLCLGGCPRQAFMSKTLDDLPLPAQEFWSLLWDLLLVPKYRNKLPTHLQRLVLEHVCKFNVHAVLKQLCFLEEKFVKMHSKDREIQATPDSDMFSVCRIGYFCITFILTQNNTLFHKNNTQKSASVDESPKELEWMNDELNALVSGAVLTTRWTETIVIPWLMSDDETVQNPELEANFQRLSRAAVESTAIFTILALIHEVFRERIETFMLPLTELASLFRNQVTNLTNKKEGKVEGISESSSNESRNHSIARFEFVVHVHRSALGFIRAHSLGRDILISWFAEYMSLLMELANASCVAVSLLNQRDLIPVAVECCNLIFLAVMASSAPPQKRNKTTDDEVSGENALLNLPFSDRDALVNFAVGSARYSSLPEVQSEGVKLLSALLGAVPDIFFVSSKTDAAPVNEALGVLHSVAMINPDPKTRALAEQVLGIIKQSMEQ